ncbi:hypothetical protein N7540_010169 [Penicillium herquei]|nr:hypothetical protein N7540_010169 [Penicillium herquei]
MQLVFPLEYTHSDVQSTKNMLSVFELSLPDSFWEVRMPSVPKEHLFFESHVLTETDANSVDWQILQLGWMSLLLDENFKTSGLRNRERLFA